MKKHHPAMRPPGQAWAGSMPIWNMIERRLSKAPWGPTVLMCSGAPEPHEWEKWELLCLSVTSLSSHIRDAMEVTILEDSPLRGE